MLRFDPERCVFKKTLPVIAKALEHYRKLLCLWKDADPGILMVGDARKRLAELKK